MIGVSSQVYTGVWIGNKSAAENVEMLVHLGISHLLNCAGGENQGGMLTGSGKVKPDQDKLRQQNIVCKELSLRVSLLATAPTLTFDIFVLVDCLQDTKDENIMSVLDDATEWIENTIMVDKRSSKLLS